jgi:hypothetical protein
MNFEGFFWHMFTYVNVGYLKVKLVKKAESVETSDFHVFVYVQSHVIFINCFKIFMYVKL